MGHRVVTICWHDWPPHRVGTKQQPPPWYIQQHQKIRQETNCHASSLFTSELKKKSNVYLKLAKRGLWASCTLYIEPSTHALTLRSIITIKNSSTILTKTKRNSLLKTSQELEGSFKTQFSSLQSAMFGCRGGLRLRILSWHSPNCCLCFTWRKKLYNTFKGKTRKRQSMLKTSYNIITSCQHKKSKHRIECNNHTKLQMFHDCVLCSIVCYQQHGCKGMRVSVI